MLLTPHAIVGMAIGSQLDRSWMVAPIAVGSHFLLDSLPHWERSVNLDTEDLTKKDAVVVLIDGFVALLLTWLFSLNNPNWEMMWLGAICAIVPDSHHLIQVLFGPEKLQRYAKAHEKYHSDKDLRFLPGVALQIVVVMISILFIGQSW